MKWISHTTISTVIVYSLTENAFALLPVFMGSIFPDSIEKILFGDWGKYHRKIFHWFVLYFVFIALTFSFLKSPMKEIVMWFFVGCLFHIVEDAISGTVPSLNLRRRIGLRLIPINSVVEYVVVLAFLFIFVLFYAEKVLVFYGSNLVDFVFSESVR